MVKMSPATTFTVSFILLLISFPAKAREFMRIVPNDGAIAQDASSPEGTTVTDIIPPGTIVEIKRKFQDPVSGKQLVAQVYTPYVKLCSNPDHPCFVPYDQHTFQRASWRDVAALTQFERRAVRKLTRPAVSENCSDAVEPPRFRRYSSLEKRAPSSEHPGTLKSYDQLERYSSCYQLDKRFTDRYREEYRYYIEAAADSFPIPNALLTCVLFRESRWNANAVNPNSGATGLGQFLPGTFRTMKNVLGAKDLSTQKLKKLSRIKETGTDGGVSRKSVTYATNVLRNYDHALNWDDYLSEVDRKEKGGEFHAGPSLASKKDPRFDPRKSVGYSALYLSRIHSVLLTAMKSTGNPMARDSNKLMSDPNYLSVVGVGYNMGEGKLADLLRPVINLPPSTWVPHLEKYWADEQQRLEAELHDAKREKKKLSFSVGFIRKMLARFRRVKSKRLHYESELRQFTKKEGENNHKIDLLNFKYGKVFEERNYLESIRRCVTKDNGEPLVDGHGDKDRGASCRL